MCPVQFIEDLGSEGLVLCSCHLEILNLVGIGVSHSHFVLGSVNHIAHPAQEGLDGEQLQGEKKVAGLEWGLEQRSATKLSDQVTG